MKKKNVFWEENYESGISAFESNCISVSLISTDEQEHNDESHNLKGLVIGDQNSKRRIFIVHFSGYTLYCNTADRCFSQH